jgi:hypothetical protein
MNAIDYEVPPERAVFYFYNPFPESVMSQVLHNIERSYRTTPRKCISFTSIHSVRIYLKGWISSAL